MYKKETFMFNCKDKSTANRYILNEPFMRGDIKSDTIIYCHI